MLKRIKENPRILFLIDGLGALLSAFLLGVVLIYFQDYIGMPKKTLYFLAAIPCFFALYDFVIYFWKPKKWQTFLLIIAILNLIYCCISIRLLFYHLPQLTYLGIAYFINELIIVVTLAIIEFKVATKDSN